ncbi:hypothetical protein SAMN04487991_2614 [Celeribacter neptunius]|uniref:Uncharacterized protein n=1 Tax=Celeribacter neptunius TaxID=588602 RepID=A0A1I3T880_9RHOB|nr:hypothetical protein SAMN04487991_2614 [Celeribacter neptunius]
MLPTPVPRLSPRNSSMLTDNFREHSFHIERNFGFAGSASHDALRVRQKRVEGVSGRPAVAPDTNLKTSRTARRKPNGQRKMKGVIGFYQTRIRMHLQEFGGIAILDSQALFPRCLL